MPIEPQQTDIVTEARDFVVTSALYKNPNRARGFIEALCNEVERLRNERDVKRAPNGRRTKKEGK